MIGSPPLELRGQPRALDLFCGAGGAAVGLARAGFEVVGVDVRAQPRYPFRFIRAHALDVPIAGFDLVWASPPCQAFSVLNRNLGTAQDHHDYLDATRAHIRPAPMSIIENVPGAPLIPDVELCGSMFGLAVRRHRLFEVRGFELEAPPPCDHRHRRPAVTVVGNGSPGRRATIEEKRAAMGIQWMNRNELSQAIPPAYAEWLGRQAREAIGA